MPADMPENISNKISSKMPDKMPKDIPNKISKNLRIRKYINNMLGFTKNKIYFFIFRIYIFIIIYIRFIFFIHKKYYSYLKLIFNIKISNFIQ